MDEGKARTERLQAVGRPITIAGPDPCHRSPGIHPTMRLPFVRTTFPSSAPARLLVTLFVLAAPLAARAAGPVRDAKPASARVSPAGLPDTVLARIDGQEDVTARRFLRAVRILGGSAEGLTPERRDEFLQLVIEQRLIARAAAASSRAWSRDDSANFARDENRILMQSALSHRLERLDARRRALGQPTLDRQAMGIALRESLMVELAPAFDTTLLARLVPAWQALPVDVDTLETIERIKRMKRLPVPAPEDTGRIVVRTRERVLTVADVIRGWDRLPVMNRPRINAPATLQAIVGNQLVEDVITRESRLDETRQRPEVAAALADRHEYYAVSAWLRTDVTSDIPTDSLTLLAHYRATPEAFTVPAKGRALMLVSETRREADSLATMLRVPGGAERMQEAAQAQGLDYIVDLKADADTLLYGIAVRAGVHGVAGPDETPSGWRTMWIESLTPPNLPPFAEVRSDVERSWKGVEGDRRIREAIDRLARNARIERNPAALERLNLPAREPHR